MPSFRTRCTAVLAAVIVVCGLVGTLAADVFRLADGRRVEGTIVREIGDLVSIKTADGVITVDRKEILDRIVVRSQLDEYRDRAAALADDDFSGHLSLARWCAENELPSESKLHYKRVISIDPEHEEGREKLGYIWFTGDWYLEGSAEIEARRKEIESTTADQTKSIPDRLPEIPEQKDPPKLPPLPKGAGKVALTLDEKIGKESPERSGALYHVNQVLRGLDEPMSANPGLDAAKADLEIRIKVRCYFLRTQDFYGAPLYHLYEGSAQIEVLERNADGSTQRVGLAKVQQPFSSSVKVDRAKALDYTYYATASAIGEKLAAMKYFRERGAKAPKSER